MGSDVEKEVKETERLLKYALSACAEFNEVRLAEWDTSYPTFDKAYNSIVVLIGRMNYSTVDQARRINQLTQTWLMSLVYKGGDE